MGHHHLCLFRGVLLSCKTRLHVIGMDAGQSVVRCFQTAVIVGGMAAQKQERLLKRCPEIVVATPGRLWELIQQVNTTEFVITRQSAF